LFVTPPVLRGLITEPPMFDSIRSHRRWLMFFLVLLVFPSFVATGIYGYNRFLSDEQALARVAGEAITPQQFEAAHRERLQQIRQALGENFDPALFDTPAAREASLNALLGERSLRREAVAANVAASENRLRQVIASVPAFQEDGRFSYERYRTLLAAEGLNEAAFEQRVRDDLARQVLLEGVARSAMVPAALAERLTALINEARTVRERRFAPQDFIAQVSIGDDQVKAYYEANRARFQTEETIDVQVVALTLDEIARQVSVPPEELRTYYEQHKASFAEPEQRRASHILLTVGDGGSAKDKESARKLAQELLARVRARPDEFAALAKEYSKDPGSAANGGDLGLFGRNMMVKPFEEAAFRMKAGEISDVVETEFGFHLIRVTEVRGGEVPPFEKVRDQIESSYRQRQAQRRFAEAAEQFTNIVYEQSDSLQPAADKLGLKIVSVVNVTRSGPPRDAPVAALLTPAVVQALFSDEALNKKRNIPAVEAGSGSLVSARVAEHRPARSRPLEEVGPQIRLQLVREQATRLAREAAAAAADDLRKAPSDKGFTPPRVVSRGQPQDLPPKALKEIMRVPADRLPAFIVADAGDGAQAVYWVLDSKLPASVDPQMAGQLRRSVEQQMAAADDLAYVAELKRKHRAEIVNSPAAGAARK
jgi:peptidyl-prolyl cis-trans isomerase D